MIFNYSMPACAVKQKWFCQNMMVFIMQTGSEAAGKNHPILTPTEKNLLESGQILDKIRADKGLSPEKLRDLHFDVLIALTARSYGARLVTSNLPRHIPGRRPLVFAVFIKTRLGRKLPGPRWMWSWNCNKRSCLVEPR